VTFAATKPEYPRIISDKGDAWIITTISKGLASSKSMKKQSGDIAQWTAIGGQANLLTDNKAENKNNRIQSYNKSEARLSAIILMSIRRCTYLMMDDV
jgi:hypothetical protein